MSGPDVAPVGDLPRLGPAGVGGGRTGIGSAFFWGKSIAPLCSECTSLPGETGHSLGGLPWNACVSGTSRGG